MKRANLPTADAFRDVLVGVLSSQNLRTDDTLDMETLSSIWAGVGLRQSDMMAGVGSLWSSGVIVIEERSPGENVLRLMREIPAPIDRDRAINGRSSLGELGSHVIRPFRVRKDSHSDSREGRRAGEDQKFFDRHFGRHKWSTQN